VNGLAGHASKSRCRLMGGGLVCCWRATPLVLPVAPCRLLGCPAQVLERRIFRCYASNYSGFGAGEPLTGAEPPGAFKSCLSENVGFQSLSLRQLARRKRSPLLFDGAKKPNVPKVIAAGLCTVSGGQGPSCSLFTLTFSKAVYCGVWYAFRKTQAGQRIGGTGSWRFQRGRSLAERVSISLMRWSPRLEGAKG
jgi:hypothetical protein